MLNKIFKEIKNIMQYYYLSGGNENVNSDPEVKPFIGTKERNMLNNLKSNFNYKDTSSVFSANSAEDGKGGLYDIISRGNNNIDTQNEIAYFNELKNFQSKLLSNMDEGGRNITKL